MLFLILATDRPDAAALRAEHRPRHVEYWLSQGSTVKLGGPFLLQAQPDAAPRGRMLIVHAEHEAAARRLVEAAPFTAERVFGDVRLDPPRITLGEWQPSPA